MKIALLSLAILIYAILPATAQKVKKLPTIRATVTVKGDGSFSVPKLPNETDEGIWNQVEFAKHQVRLEFPSKLEDILDDVTLIENGKVWSYAAYTKRGKYQLIVRDLPAMLDNRGIDEVIENSIARVYTDGKIKLLEKRTFYYEGRLAKEIVVEDKKTIQKARFYILNKKLFAIYVTVEPKTSRSQMEKWIQRFLDSFKVEVPINNQT